VGVGGLLQVSSSDHSTILRSNMNNGESRDEGQGIGADRSDMPEGEVQEAIEKPLLDQDPYSDLADDIDVGPATLSGNEEFL
jgi:hypothetical protein